jgi:hypothetical protein
LNDTILALDCDDNHKGVIWSKHRSDEKIMACDGTTLSWVDSSALSRDIYDLNDDDKNEAFWNTENWYKCMSHYGDDIGKDEGDIIDYDHEGQLLCYDYEWKRCTETIQDVMPEGYCCISDLSPPQICNKDNQKDNQYCCECFGNTWDSRGFCIGDGVCENDEGEDVSNSPNDCCNDDCTAVYDTDTCYSACNGYNGCSLAPGCDSEAKGSSYCSGDTAVTCCETSENCNDNDGCYGDYYRDYYCYDDGYSVYCEYSEDDCSDCSCSCGGYNVDESSANDNCNDGKDNDCDGQTDSADPGCSLAEPEPCPAECACVDPGVCPGTCESSYYCEIGCCCC